MKAALLFEEPGRLVTTEVGIDKPARREVLIRTVGSGLCHSDLHHVDHRVDASTPPEARPPRPILLGHEASGIVEAVGDDVTYVKPGDHVITSGNQFCGECEFCIRGEPSICVHNVGARAASDPPRLTLDGTRVFQYTNIGGFAEQMLVHERAVVKIDPEYPFDKAALLGCGVATGIGAALNTARVRPGSSVAVIGCGGVGIAVIQGARVAGARQIIAIDTQPEKFALARELGATHCVDASLGDPVEQVQELTGGGVDYSFEALGTKATVEQAFFMLRSAGVATTIGVSTGVTVELPINTLVIGERRLQGSLLGSCRMRIDVPRFIELDQAGLINLDAMIERHITLDEITDGYNAMREKAIVGRRVIMFPQ